MLREARRNSVSYRPHALSCLGDFVSLVDDLDLYEAAHDLVAPIIRELGTEDDQMDIDTKSGTASSGTM